MPMQRVTKQRPCPICGKPDWCLLSEDRKVAICARARSSDEKFVEHSGWLHAVDPDAKINEYRSKREIELPERNPDLAAMQVVFMRAANERFMVHASDMLGVTEQSLKDLGIGYDRERDNMTFPMLRHGKGLVGIRTRALKGKSKAAIKGSRQGLFIPRTKTDKPGLSLVEGPTDAAALLSAGLYAIGRPQALGGGSLILEFLKAEPRFRSVAVWADREGWVDTDDFDLKADGAGWLGACKLASDLLGAAEKIVVVFPPKGYKDARAWVQGGATRKDIVARIEECRKLWSGTSLSPISSSATTPTPTETDSDTRT